jgi:hypothetical protein
MYWGLVKLVSRLTLNQKSEVRVLDPQHESLKYINGKTRYSPDMDRSVVPFKVIKTAEAKAWEDIKKWLEQ